MQSLKLYGVYDMVAQLIVGDVLMLFPSDGAASRFFIDVARDPKSRVASHPNDYALVCFGQFEEDNTGDIFISAIQMATRSPIVLGKDVGSGPGSDPAQLSMV